MLTRPGPDLRGGELGQRPLRAVRRPDADPVALGDPGRDQAPGPAGSRRRRTPPTSTVGRWRPRRAPRGPDARPRCVRSSPRLSPPAMPDRSLRCRRTPWFFLDLRHSRAREGPARVDIVVTWSGAGPHAPRTAVSAWPSGAVVPRPTSSGLNSRVITGFAGSSIRSISMSTAAAPRSGGWLTVVRLT
jgi:hypothetical protein